MCIYIYVYIYMYICEISIWSQSTCPLSNSGNYQTRRASMCRSWPRTAAWSSWLSRGLKVENRQFYGFLLHRRKKRRGTFHKVSFLSGLPCKGLVNLGPDVRCGEDLLLTMSWTFFFYRQARCWDLALVVITARIARLAATKEAGVDVAIGCVSWWIHKFPSGRAEGGRWRWKSRRRGISWWGEMPLKVMEVGGMNLSWIMMMFSFFK